MNPGDHSWLKIGSKDIYQSDYVSLSTHHIRTPNEEELEDFHIVDYGLGASGMILLNSDQQILMVKHYRYPLDQIYWEIPAGRIDVGETAEQAAMRELKEETGYLAKNVKKLGSSFPVVGNSSLEFHFYLGEADVHLDSEVDSEVIEFSWFSVSEVKDLIRSGDVVSGLCLGAFCHYFMLLDR